MKKIILLAILVILLLTSPAQAGEYRITYNPVLDVYRVEKWVPYTTQFKSLEQARARIETEKRVDEATEGKHWQVVE